MKNDKSPGPNEQTSDFKSFFNNMGYFITRTLKSYNELLQITELNKLGIITFLPEEILK